MGEAAKSAVPKLLRLALSSDRNDPFEMSQRYVAVGLFNSQKVFGDIGILSKSLEGVDRQVLYAAVEKILQNPDGLTRGVVGSVYNNLTFEELKPLFPAIIKSIKEPSPSGVMFSGKSRIGGFQLLAKHKVREGLELSIVDIMDIEKWGKAARITGVVRALKTYGVHAKPYLPQLRELEKDLLAHQQAKGWSKQLVDLRKLIETVENSKERPRLKSFR